MSKPVRDSSNEKVVCVACANTFPADSPTCPTCKWVQDTKPPNAEQMTICTLRRIARALDTLRYYAWDDRIGSGRRG